MKVILLFLLVNLFWTLELLAAEALVFPADKNNVQILPQRFEYELINESQFRIGDQEIDLQLMSFQLVSKGSEIKFRFQWPAGLIKDGEIVIKDNTGKALFAYPMKTETGHDEKLIKFDSPYFDKEDLKKLEYYPFFKFCLQKQENRTKIYLCSKDLYIKPVSGKITIHSRDSLRQESFVEINGRPVGTKGIIFLTNQVEAISMRALMLSGASFEIDTRKKPVDFRDIILTEDGKSLIIRAQGAEPADESNVKRISEDEWEATIPIERPTIFLKGEGDVHMRQEFITEKGTIRKESVRIYYDEIPPTLSYDSEETLVIKNLSDYKFSPYDNKSKISGNGSLTDWTLLRLQKGSKNRRYIKVTGPEASYVGAADVQRGYPFEASVRLSLPLYYAVNFEWWPTIPVGININYSGKITGEKDSAMDIRAKWRFQRGLHMKDNTYGLSLFQMSLDKTEKPSLMGAGFYIEQKLKDESDYWMLGKFDLPLSMSGVTGATLKTSWLLEITGRKFLNETRFIDAGINHSSMTLSSDAGNLNFGKTLIFVSYGSLF